MKKSYRSTLWDKIIISILGAWLQIAHAVPDLGEMTDNILEPTSILSEVAYKICYILGAALLIGSGVQYRTHRINPLQVRLSQVVLLLIFGVGLIALPIIAQYSPASETVSR